MSVTQKKISKIFCTVNCVTPMA